MGLGEWMRFHRQEWAKNSAWLFNAQLKCHLLHETFPNSSPSHFLFNYSRSKWITLIIIFIACPPPPSLVSELKFSIISTAIKLEEETRGSSVQWVPRVGHVLLCFLILSLVKTPQPHHSLHPICPSASRDTFLRLSKYTNISKFAVKHKR